MELSDILGFIVDAILVYLGIGLVFFAFAILYAAIKGIRLPGEDYGWALVGAVLFWPKLLIEFLSKR